MKSPRTPRGRAALAALAVGGGVAVVIGITGSAAVAGSMITTTIGTPTAPPVTTIEVPPPPPRVELPLTVSKTAYLFYTRVNSWDIDKWASPQAGWDKKDQSVAVDYSVKVTKRWKAVNIRVFGEITVRNPNETPYLVQVGDDLPGGVCAIRPPRVMLDQVAAAGLQPIVPSSNPVIIPVGPGNTVLRYVCQLEKLPKRKVVNTAWIKWRPFLLEPVAELQPSTTTALPEWTGNARGTADVALSEARYRDIDGVVKVIDTLDGDETRLLEDHLTESRTFTYRRYLSFWRKHQTCRIWENTAKVAPAPRQIPLPDVVEAPQMRLLPEIPEIDPPMPVVEWAETASATVKICPPDAPTKGKPGTPTVEVTNPKGGTGPVDVTPADNPKGPVVKDNKSKGRLLVSKIARSKTAEVGDIVTWVIRVKNIGKAELYGVKVIDVLPKDLVPIANDADNQDGNVLATIKSLAPGDAEVIVVRTQVKGKPAPTPNAVAQTRKLKTAKDRDEALRRLRRGLICNVARATTRKGPSDSDIACIRIVRKPVPAQPVE